MVRLLDRSVLVRSPWRVPIRFHPVMRHRSEVALVERPASLFQIVRGRREVVGPMPVRYAPELAHRSLEPRHERLERLREAHHPCLPSRVRQHEVVHQVIERLAPDGDLQVIHRRVVALRVLTWPRLLREHHFLLRPVLRSPPTDLPLQRSQLPFREASLRPLEQPLEDRLPLQPRRRLQHLLHLRPHPLERVRPGSIRPRRPPFFPRCSLPIPPRRVLAHPALQCRPLQRLSIVQLFHQSPHLLVIDQSHPPLRAGAR